MYKAQNLELDEQLKQLALTAQQHPPMTNKRRLALTKLVNGILESGRLCRPLQSQFIQSVYEDIYNEARQNLLLYIYLHIDKYEPDRAEVMTWVNVLLSRRFFKEAIAEILEKSGIQRMSLSDLDNFAPPEEPPVLWAILKECIESDSKNLFKKEHIKGNPKANFHALAKQRIDGKSWKEIATEFDLKIPTLSCFYYRCLKKFAACLKEEIQLD